MKVLIVTYRRPDLVERCLSQAAQYFGMSDLIVVDNKSDDSPEIAAICAAKGIELIQNPENAGFARAVNIGMRHVTAHESPDPWVLLLNPDAEVLCDPQSLTRLAVSNTACITTFNAAEAAPWDCEKPIPNPWRAAFDDAGLGWIRIPQPFGSRYRSYSPDHRGYLVGCFLLISTAAWIRIGEFDERFWLYSEETDWCLRAHNEGLTCLVVPILGHRHEAGQTTEGSVVAESLAHSAYHKSRRLFIEKHWGRMGLITYTFTCSALDSARRVVRSCRRRTRLRTDLH